jgi:hypothetical protein
MRQAIRAVKNKEMGPLKADKSFNVPRSTLKDYVKTYDTDIEKPPFNPDVFTESVSSCQCKRSGSCQLVSPGDTVPSTYHRGTGDSVLFAAEEVSGQRRGRPARAETHTEVGNCLAGGNNLQRTTGFEKEK